MTPYEDPCRVDPSTPLGKHITFHNVTSEEAQALHTFHYLRRITSPEDRLSKNIDLSTGGFKE
jgi:hypothetical protein